MNTDVNRQQVAIDFLRKSCQDLMHDVTAAEVSSPFVSTYTVRTRVVHMLQMLDEMEAEIGTDR